jgi:ATP-dependent helicase/nuclease subunit B
MSFRAIESTALFERLAALPATAQGACVVLCASPRLAAGLQDAYGRWQARRGVSVWAAVPMTTAEVFVRELAQRAAAQQALLGQPTASVLSAAESDLLWRIVVSEARSDVLLLRESEAARQAAEAWKLCQAYGLRLPLDATTPDVERYNQWAQSYRERLRRLARIDAGESWQWVLRQLDAAAVKAPSLVILAGFEQPAPALQSLFSALERGGSEMLQLQPAEHAAQCRGRAAASAEHELRAAAQWVRDTVLAQPQARVGVIVPDLGARRADLLRVFDEVLCPQREVLDSSPRERPYNLSLGQSLAEIGVVAGALQILRLCTSGITLDQATALLCAPYWGDAAADVLARAEVDRQLRDEGEWQVSLQALRRRAWRHPALAAQLDRLSTASAQRDRADAGVWAERFSRWLEAAAWPGPRSPDSAEYQALEAWREILHELGSVGRVLGKVPASGALMQLQQLAARRVFQPQTPPVNVQVLGALEAKGLDFDALWVMGLDDQHWPPTGRPNPFIPFALQRSLAMPHASTAQELEWAQRCTLQWRRAAPQVIFSWPLSDGDQQLQASPLIADVQLDQCTEVSGLPEQWQESAASGSLVRIADAYAPPPDRSRAVPGGARLLGDQARCPFRAHAVHRLGAQPWPRPGYGPSPSDRGQLLHRALERLWRELRDHATLVALDPATLAGRVHAAVEQTVLDLARRAPQRMTPAFQLLEMDRLTARILEWMALEAQRAPFSVVQLEGSGVGEAPSQQGRTQFEFCDILLSLRADRIDRVHDGGHLVLDYKSGARKKTPWADGRPEEPQLLLYGLLQADVDAVSFGYLDAGRTGFDGIAAHEDLAPGLKSSAQHSATREVESWTALLGQWRGRLETLAAEVARGLASVTPKNLRQSCRDCHLHAACRIGDVMTASEDADDEDGMEWPA